MQSSQLNLISYHNLDLIPQPNDYHLVPDNVLPPRQLITAAFDDLSLMTNLNERGWHIPGGHLEYRESPETAVIRECRGHQVAAFLGWIGLNREKKRDGNTKVRP